MHGAFCDNGFASGESAQNLNSLTVVSAKSHFLFVVASRVVLYVDKVKSLFLGYSCKRQGDGIRLLVGDEIDLSERSRNENTSSL